MINRTAVRALLLSEPDNLLLLMRIFLPDSDTHIWLAPGGGIESDEDPGASLVREVREETGYILKNWTGPVWTRRHVFDFQGNTYDQSEAFYLARTPRFEPDHRQNPAQYERALFREFCWWSLDQMNSSNEIFVPRLLPEHLKELIDSGLPTVPLEVGV